MPIAEPPSDLGLWPQVKARSGWPETDEDAVRDLATAWRRGGDAFAAAGAAGGAGGLAAAWPDAAGEAYAAKVEEVRKATAETGQAMHELAARVETFAAGVAGTKSAIVALIEANIPIYESILTLPQGAGQVAMESFVAQLAAEVKRLIDDAAGRAAGLAAGVPVPTVPAPPMAEVPSPLAPPMATVPLPPVEKTEAGVIGDWAGAASAFLGALSFIPGVGWVTAPLAIATGAIALAGHGMDIYLRQTDGDPRNDVSGWDWAGVAGDVFGVIPGVGVAVKGAQAASSATDLFSAARVIGGVAAADGARASAVAREAARLAGARSDEAVETAAQSLQGGLDVALQVPAAQENLDVEVAEDDKNAATVGSAAFNVAKLVR